MQFKEQKTFEGMSVSPEDMRRAYEQSRIDMDPQSFSPLYSSVKHDIGYAERMRKQHETQPTQEMGHFAEALVFDSVRRGAFGNNVSARAPSDYDDLVHAADIIIETVRGERDPIVSSIDVTISQQTPRESRQTFEEMPLDKKLKKVRLFIDHIATYSRDEAIDLHAWMMSGGLAERQTDENRHLFEKAERVMLLKYYKTPKGADDPHKPRFVLAGPQAVVSLDRSFLNKVLTSKDQKSASQDVDALVQTEIPFAIASLFQYVSKVAQRLKQEGKGSNLFLDILASSYKSWEMTFGSDVSQMKIQRAMKRCLADPSLRSQLVQYRESLNQSLR